MRSDNTKIILQSALLFASVTLTACGGGSEPPEPIAASASVPAPAITSLGTDFYLTLPDHLCVSNPSSCNNMPVKNYLIVSADAATNGEVTFNGVITPFAIAAGAESVITLDPAVVLTANETVEAKGIHLTSQLPVSVHVVSENATSADGYLALPTPGLGTKYYVMSYASSRYSGSEFALVATQNNTTVSITPSAAGATKPVGVAFTVTLNSGETYQLVNPANADMTGTFVTSDKPVAVFSGHRCADVPSGVGYCDYLVEQVPDISLWGKTFHTAPFSGRSRYTVRVIASQNGTTFTTIPAGMTSIVLNAGQFADVEMTGASEFVSNNSVLMAQFMRGYDDEAVPANKKGDPSLVLVTPAEMGMTDATFGVHGLKGTNGAYMNVVTETAALSNMKLDNVAVDSAQFMPFGGTSIYSIGSIPIATGAHSLSGTVPFSAFVYDYGISLNAVSYAYPVASRLSLPAAQVINPSPTDCETHLQEDDHNLADSLEHQSRHSARNYHGDMDDDGYECDK